MPDDPTPRVPFTPVVRMGVITPGGQPAQILAPDPNRLVMVLSYTATSGAGILYLGSANSAGFKFTVASGIPVIFDYGTVGDICFQSLWTDGAGLTAPASWMTLSRM